MEKTLINKGPKPKEEKEEYPELKALKKQYGKVRTLKVKNEKFDEYCFIKEPDRFTIGKAMVFFTKEKLVEAGEVILRECFVGGSDKFLTEDKLILSGALKCVEIIEVYESEWVEK